MFLLMWCMYKTKTTNYILLHVSTDEDGNDSTEIVTNEEIPECTVTGGEDQLTNLETDFDSNGNSTNGYLVSFA